MSRLESLQQAIIAVLGQTHRRLTRTELAAIDAVARVHRNPDAIRRAVRALIKAGLVREPEGRGRGLELTEPGRRSLGQGRHAA